MEEQRPQAQQQLHFLVVSHPFQGHINPTLRLAKRLAAIDTAAAVTFSTTVSSHRRMLRSHLSSAPDQEFHDGVLSYIPFSDGYDDGFQGFHIPSEAERFYAQLKLLGSQNLASLLTSLASRGRPVTCIIYSPGVYWAADVARDSAVPSALYWIQPATGFAVFYHYFHGYDGLIAAHSHDPSFEVRLPALPPLQIRDLPSVLTIRGTDDPHLLILALIKEAFDSSLSKDATTRAKVLVNTFDALEMDALVAIDGLDLIAIGPEAAPPVTTVDEKKKFSSSGFRGDLFKPDEKRYMEWLDSKPAKSVVYVSFGSVSVLKKRQLEEISHGLKGSGRPYLWVVRRDNRSSEEGEVELEDQEEGEEGMVVSWCDQVRVLSHPAVGCFVTHCGWNSTVETLVCGVPTVAVPQSGDQPTNARLMEDWGTGVRAVVTAEEGGVLEGRELRRCVDVVMGGEEMRRKAEMWRDKAREAVSEGGSSDRNMRAFVEGMRRSELAI